jgi:hypothetical protein
MMRLFVLTILAGAFAPATTGLADEDKPPLIRLAPQASAQPSTPLHYRLLPDPAELTAGNAAPLWYQVALRQRAVPHKITEEEYKWAESASPLQKLPRSAVRSLLIPYGGAFRLARLASLRTSCDWEHPPLTWQNLGVVDTSHVQSFREIALLLNIQCRLQLSERRFDDAADTLRTGFSLARHLGKGNTLIECLVGLSTAESMLSRIEEWMQIPGSPNLYWPLSALPNPLVEIQTAFEQELNIVYRSFPELRQLRNNQLSPREVDAALLGVYRFMNLVGDPPKGKDRPISQKLTMAMMTAKMYSEARQRLLDRGWPVKNVDAMRMKQVTMIVELEAADRLREDVQKCLSLPSWHALPELSRVEREARATPESRQNVFTLGMAAYSTILAARIRVERHIAALRCGEALRLYAAEHEGKPPAKWSDITSVPLPIDPSTGKGFDTFYDFKQGRALLNVPEMRGRGIGSSGQFEWRVNP